MRQTQASFFRPRTFPAMLERSSPSCVSHSSAPVVSITREERRREREGRKENMWCRHSSMPLDIMFKAQKPVCLCVVCVCVRACVCVCAPVCEWQIKRKQTRLSDHGSFTWQNTAHSPAPLISRYEAASSARRSLSLACSASPGSGLRPSRPAAS